MSAREDLAHELVNGRIAYRGQLSECQREVAEALDAYRAEVLREAAEELRRWADAGEKWLFDEELCGAHAAADHIDPDKDDRRSAAP